MATKKTTDTTPKPGADPTKSDKAGKAKRADLLKTARERFDSLSDYWKENKSKMLDDIKFRAGDQWPEAIKRQREKANRPALVVDKTEQYVRQVVNDGRQNRPGINFPPKNDGAVEVSNALKGLTRAVLSASNADIAFDTALDHSAGHGLGYFRVLTDYESETSFNQVIKVARVRNSLAVLPGIFQTADGSDMTECFVIDDMPTAQFEEKFPQATKTDWKSDGAAYGTWLNDKIVRVAEYYYIERVDQKIVLLKDGSSCSEEDYAKSVAELGEEGVAPVVNRRTAKVNKVKWCRLSGAEILEENEWAGSFIPVIPVIGTERDINGKVIFSGLIRAARDPQMLYNFSRTAYAERVALAPKTPWVAAVGQTTSDPGWKNAHSDNIPVLHYDPVDVNGNVLPAPQRTMAADVPAGYAAEMQTSEHDIQSSIGMYAASVGQPSNEKSGRAIMARQREGDVGTFHYHDNLNRSIRHLGRILLELYPKIYDTRRVVRLLGEDGETEEAVIDPTIGVPMLNDGAKKVFNLGMGEYDVDVEAGASYTTRRQEAQDMIGEMVKGNPAMWTTHGDLIAKMQDWPGAEEIAERTRAVMPPPIKQAIAEQEQAERQGMDPKMQAVVSNAQQQIQMREQALKAASDKIEELTQALQSAQKEGETKEGELLVKAYDAITKRIQVEGAAMTPEQITALTTQTVQQAMSQSNPVADFGPIMGGMLQAMQAQAQAHAGGLERLTKALLAPVVRTPIRNPNTGIIDAIHEQRMLPPDDGPDGKDFPGQDPDAPLEPTEPRPVEQTLQ